MTNLARSHLTSSDSANDDDVLLQEQPTVTHVAVRCRFERSDRSFIVFLVFARTDGRLRETTADLKLFNDYCGW